MGEARMAGQREEHVIDRHETKVVCIAGNIGVGKTTLVSDLHRDHGWQVVPEPHEENPFLERFYHDMGRWAFHSQMFFLTKRLLLYLDAWEQTGIFIQDRTIFEDAEVFARNLFLNGNFGGDEYHCYEDLYKAILRTIRPPSVVIYLRAEPEILMQRIARRGRTYERAVAPSYIAQLNDLYDTWAHTFALCPLRTIDTSALDIYRHPDQRRTLQDICRRAVEDL